MIVVVIVIVVVIAPVIVVVHVNLNDTVIVIPPVNARLAARGERAANDRTRRGDHVHDIVPVHVHDNDHGTDHDHVDGHDHVNVVARA